MRYALCVLALIVSSIFSNQAAAQDVDKQIFQSINAANAAQVVEVMSWEGGYVAAAFSPDGKTLSIALNDGRVQFLSLDELEISRVFELVETSAEWLDFNADGSKLLLSNRFGEYTLWDVNTGEVITSGKISQEELWFIPTPVLTKYYLYSILDDFVGVYDLITQRELLSVSDAHRFDLSPDGEYLLTRNSHQVVQIWDVATGQVIFEIEPPSANVIEDPIAGAGFTPEGQVWVNWPQVTQVDDNIIWDSPIQFWDIESQTMIFQLDGSDFFRALVFDPSGTYITAFGIRGWSFSESCWIWRVADNEQIGCPASGRGDLDFSPDGTLLAYDGDENTIVNTMETFSHPVAVLETPLSRRVTFSPDGRFLLTVGWQVQLWGVPSNG